MYGEIGAADGIVSARTLACISQTTWQSLVPITTDYFFQLRASHHDFDCGGHPPERDKIQDGVG